MVFTGDALWGMAFAKAMADGEIAPILAKDPVSFGAPFQAHWNDFPSVEEGVDAWWALLVWAFGPFRGSNLALLSAHLLAGGTFYGVCRYLRYSQILSLAGAALFALSRYVFWRNLPNLALSFYWHLPLGLLVIWWCVRETPISQDRKKLLVCAAVSVLYGVQSAYYSGMFLQLLFWAAVFCILRWRDWRRTILPVSLIGVLLATLVLMNVDTLSSWFVNGPNAAAATRSLPDVERYALRPVEFFLPHSHSFRSFARWANQAHFDATMIPGEMGSAYLGVIGILALATLICVTASAIAKGDLEKVPPHFWCCCLVIAFSMIGGINNIAALFGFQSFRAGNRYSIVILTVLLLFMVKRLTLLTRNWSTGSVAVLSAFLIATGIFDQIPPRNSELETAAQRAWKGDQKLVSEMEARLPNGAMIFEMPVHDFPEGYLIGGMDDYEHFRPYLHSRALRFSYADIKGRQEGRWQKEAEQLGPYYLVKVLEEYGFSAVLINKNGYGDQAVSLLEGLRSAGKSRVLAHSDDWVSIALNPVRQPSLPTGFGVGWYPLGPTNWRWSSGDATLVLHNPNTTQRTVALIFGLTTLKRRYVEISAENQTLFDGVVNSDGPRPMNLRMILKPGKTEVRFATDRPGELLANGDTRKLAFSVIDFKVK